VISFWLLKKREMNVTYGETGNMYGSFVENLSERTVFRWE
jgi:hypothetical protein